MTPLARDLARAFPQLRTSDDDADRVAYARDLWPRHHLDVRAGRPAEHRPGAIAWPTSTDDVVRLVRWARTHGAALVPFGAGSGVCAGVLPDDGMIVVDLKRMGRIRRLDTQAPLVDVEAGHMGVPLERALEAEGFTLGHFPSSILCSTVGGWIAARSAGQCSGAYGKIEDMVASVECVTGRGDVAILRRRTSLADLVPLVVGSEGTLAVVTSVTLRLHPAPSVRAFGAWSFPSTPRGWEALRAVFQAGLRPSVARLYDPFDAVFAKKADRSAGASRRDGNRVRPPGLGGVALRAALKRPGALNDLLQSRIATRALGGSLLVVIFEGEGDAPRDGMAHAMRIAQPLGGAWEGDGPARQWLAHRYAVSYRQAPLFANGAFVDTMEVAARWSSLARVYSEVRRALGRHVLVMAHLSHAYPDGCCIYFSFAGTADPALAPRLGWDAACAATYDRAWKSAIDAALAAGASLAHHHGVGRSKAPRMRDELGAGVGVVRAIMRAFDPDGILNPGNLVPPVIASEATIATVAATQPPLAIDRESLLACVDGTADLATTERALNDEDLTLDLDVPCPTIAVADWLALGAPGTRDRWLDPVDQVMAGFDATLADGRVVSTRPAPRRAVGPDLAALFVGANGRFGRIDRAWLRVHRRGVARPVAFRFAHERDPAPNAAESALVDAIARGLAEP